MATSLWDLSDLATPWCVHVAATLGIADHIESGVSQIDQLAAAAGADTESLLRILRQLVAKGMFEEPESGRFALNEMARGLLGDGRHGFDLNGFGGRMAHAWSTLLTAVKTGSPAYHEVFGRPFWEDLEANPEIAAEFDALMGAGHRTPSPEVLFDAADWGSIHTVVDVGGGTGTLLGEILRARPHVHGTLVDLPRTVGRVASSDRLTLAGQSFFDPLPAGKDLYLLKSVLCDWPDAEALAILRRLAEAAAPSGRVMVLNGVAPGEKASSQLLMMVLVGGRDRTLDEFREMAGAAGLDVHAAGALPSFPFAVECRPR